MRPMGEESARLSAIDYRRGGAPNFKDDAACQQADPELFFPINDKVVPPRARMICDACPVRQRCYEFAMASPSLEWGIWAGTTRVERISIRRREHLLRKERADEAAKLGKA